MVILRSLEVDIWLLMFLTFVRVQVVWLCTCIASILLGLDLGLAAGLGVELISVVLRTQLLVFSNKPFFLTQNISIYFVRSWLALLFKVFIVYSLSCFLNCGSPYQI